MLRSRGTVQAANRATDRQGSTRPVSSAAHKPPLTEQEYQCFTVVHHYIATHGWPPSFSEVADQMGLHSTASAHIHLHGLADKGYLVLGGSSRQIRICMEPVNPAEANQGLRRKNRKRPPHSGQR